MTNKNAVNSRDSASEKSLRLSGLAVPIPVTFGGDAFAVKKTTPLLEDARHVEIFDQKVDPEASTWEGKASLDKFAVASHNPGSTVAPLSAQVTWRFVRE